MRSTEALPPLEDTKWSISAPRISPPSIHRNYGERDDAHGPLRISDRWVKNIPGRPTRDHIRPRIFFKFACKMRSPANRLVGCQSRSLRKAAQRASSSATAIPVLLRSVTGSDFRGYSPMSFTCLGPLLQ